LSNPEPASFTIDWGTGTPDVATATTAAGVFVPLPTFAPGLYLVQVTASTPDGVSPVATAQIVVGTGNGDSIIVSGANPGDVQASINNSVSTFHGAELVVVTDQGGSANFTVNFGSTLTTPLYVFGGGDASGDTLNANGAPGDNNFVKKTTASTTITWGPRVGVSAVQPLETVVYSAVLNTVINGGTGTNSITDPGSHTTINGGPGQNTIVITATFGTGVIINGGGGSNTYVVDLGSLAGPVTINNSNAGAANNVTVNAPAGNNTIAASGNQVTEAAQTVQINTSLLSLAIVGGPDADQISVSNLSVPVQSLSVSGGAGSDQITISSPAAPIGSVSVDGGTGTDSVALNNLGAQVTAVTVAGGSDGDQIQVQGALPSQVHLPPTVGAIAVPPPTALGSAVSTSASFTDLDGGSHTAVWNWGDNTTSTGTVTPQTSTTGSITGSHIYGATGVYTVTLTVSDPNQQSGQASLRYAVVYDPSAGFVTGGGWITSPLGAYTPNPALTGKANFGFESKYKKGATVPTGTTQFSFSLGNLTFLSTSYDWLVVAGAKAQFKGSGQINYAGSYAFMLTAIDGGLPGGHNQDTFRIKIWDKVTGTTVYDNQLGASDTADPATALGGGSIVIHSSNQLLNEPPLEGPDIAPLTMQEVRPIEEQAIRLWVLAGAQPGSFTDVNIQIVDLPGSGVGLAAADSIWLDKDAAGHGWFVDPAPGESSEFSAGASEYLSPGHANPAYGKVDLLTVVAHELGHVLGYEDSGATGLMAEYLGTGVRRLPTPIPTADQAIPPPHNPRAGALGTGPRPLTAASAIASLPLTPWSDNLLSLPATSEAAPSAQSAPGQPQPPLAVLEKKNSGWVPLAPGARARMHSKAALDIVFAGLEPSRSSTDFTDYTAWK
jgi:hypothetical protein